MIFVTDDDGGIPVFGMFANDGLDFYNPRAGRVDDLKIDRFEFFFGRRRHPVSSDQNRTGSPGGNLVQHGDVFRL